MRTIKSSRRTALKLLLAGSVASIGVGCAAISALPRGQSGSSTDGKALSLDVRDALHRHPDTAQLIVDIASEADEVFIKGNVNSSSDVNNVEIIANRVDGVRIVLMDVYVR